MLLSPVFTIAQTVDPLARRFLIQSHYLSFYTFLFCVMSIQHAIIPINKTFQHSQALFQAFKACIQQETLTNVSQTWRQKEEAIH